MGATTLSDALARQLSVHAERRGITVETMLENWLNIDETTDIEDLGPFFALSRDMVCIVDAEGFIQRVNESFTRILGYDIDDLIGNHLLDFIHPDDRESTLEVMHAHVAGEPVEQYENRYLCADGSFRWLSWSVSPTTEGRTYAIARDVTDRKLFEEELLSRNEELDAFSGAVAHDLKAPIASIIGFASLLGTYADRISPEELAETVEEIIQSGNQARVIIDSLLLLARVRKIDNLIVDRINMMQIVEEATNRLQPQIVQRAAVLQMPRRWPDAIGYGPWIEQVWYNYISNAIKYGGTPPVIELGADTDKANGHVRYWVRDNGPGIDPSQQDKLFKPFTRLNHIKVEGHGLGLSIVRRIIEKLGGKVAVESKEAGGTCFSFTLPTHIP